MRQLLICLCLVIAAPSALAADNHSMAGRICSNSACGMCLGLHLQAGHGVSSLSSVSNWFDYHAQLHQPVVKYTFSATPQVVVDGMLQIARPQKDEVLYDLGCGDGRIVITAARKYGCRAVGVEIDKEIAALARLNVRKAGLEHLVTIIVADARTISLDDADIVTLYLFPDLMKELEPEIFKSRCIVSYSHEIPGVPSKKWHVKKYPIYSWQRNPWSMIGL